MNSAAERDVAIRLAIETYIEGLRALTLVDVGRTVHDDDGRSLRYRTAVGQLGVFRRDTPDAEGHRRLPTEEFFDRACHTPRVLGDLAAMLGVLGQERVHTGQRIADGIEPGDEHE